MIMDLIETFYNDILAALGLDKMDALGRLAFYRLMILLLSALLMWFAFWFFKRILKPVVSRIVEHTQVSWDDHLFNEKVLNTTCHLIPPIVLFLMVPVIFYPFPDIRMPEQDEAFRHFCYAMTKIYMVAVVIRWCFVVLSSIRLITDEMLDHRNSYVLGVIQLFKIIIGFVGFIIIVSILINRSPVALFAGLGAAATILMLVFKDSILGLVAGVQLSSNDMLRKGDWITVPQSGADGYVEEISLSTVKVRNFDNTITTIPPYSLISQSFQNWRGMQTSDGRRVRRSLLIDTTTIHRCSEQECREIAATGLIDVAACPENERVNLILFCRAMECFLRSENELVNTDMKLMVRQMPVTAQGLPVEFYFFLRDKEWVTYEHNMSTLLARIITLVPRFGLKLYQAPSGRDLLALNAAREAASQHVSDVPSGH